MAISDSPIGTLSHIIDTVIPADADRTQAKLELLKLHGSPEWASIQARLAKGSPPARIHDVWTRRARPSFLYVMYIMLLWALPMGLIGAIDADMAEAITHSITRYLNALPEPLYALFGTGYLGYSAMRQWGKNKGTER